MGNDSIGSADEAAAPWIAYVGPFGFPEGGAAARRVLGNAMSLVLAGYSVTVASGQASSGRAPDLQVAPGIDVVSLDERSAEHWPRPLRRMRYAAMGKRTVDWLDTRRTPPAAVILYSGYSPYLVRLLSWGRRAGVPIMFDAVEWYEADGILGTLASPYQWNIELAMRRLLPRTDGAIAISRYLESYLASRGVPALRIPPTLDVLETRFREHADSDGRLRLVYAGSPGTKDALDALLAAVIAVDPEGARLRFDIFGVGESDLSRYPSMRKHRLGPLSPVRAMGTVAQGAALDAVRDADFSLLLRPDGRVASAGFPTKFVESFAVGTPVIANITSDLAEHLRDGETGFVVAGPRAEDLVPVLQRALAMGSEKRTLMRAACRRHAERIFDYRGHSAPLGAFIRRVTRRSPADRRTP